MIYRMTPQPTLLNPGRRIKKLTFPGSKGFAAFSAVLYLNKIVGLSMRGAS